MLKRTLLLFGFITTLFFLLPSFQAKQNPCVIIKKDLIKDYDNYLESIEKLISKVEALDDDQVRTEYLNIRSKFKRVELFVAHIDPEYHRVYINSAPLPRLGQFDNKPDTVNPTGLQVIDEIVFEDNIPKGSLTYYLQKLFSDSKKFRYTLLQTNLTDRVVLEAIRYDILRVYTLGLTGFDTPGSVNAINDAIASFSNQNQDLKLYYDLLEDEKLKISDRLYEGLLSTLKNSSFDDLDRLKILKDYIDPLFKNVLDIHDEIGFEKINEVLPLPSALNYNAKGLFDPELLDPFYFADLPSKDNHSKRAELGKLLFFDPILSSNNERSCASCHHPKLAFTDGKKASRSLKKDENILRNSQTLINAIYSKAFFHDLRAKKLSSQFEHVIFNEDEFNTNWKEILSKISLSKEYHDLFKQAFPDFKDKELISVRTFKLALTSFIISLRSLNSTFDKYVRNEIQDYSDEARNGYNLFMGKGACGTCHFAPVFNGTVPPYFEDSESEVLGVPKNDDFENPILDNDAGRYDGAILDRHSIYLRSFKTPTIRNIELTGPYMHNGVYKDLDQVMKFYNEGGGVGLGLQLDNQTLPFDSLSFSEKEIQDIISFMKTLTDTTLISITPNKLPSIDGKPELNNRVVGGVY